MCPTDPFDADRLRIPHTGNLIPWGVKRQTPCEPRRPRIPRHKHGELFLKGPIPWRWLVLAAQLPGRALAVGVALWHLVGMQKHHTVRLPPSKARSLGLSPRCPSWTHGPRRCRPSRRGSPPRPQPGRDRIGRDPGRWDAVRPGGLTNAAARLVTRCLSCAAGVALKVRLPTGSDQSEKAL